MNSWSESFRKRLQLLVDSLPAVAIESRFALKGGTAINLFEHDLPRLSVDIDLTWLPVGDFATDGKAISDALRAMGERLSAPPLRLQVRSSAPEAAQFVTRLIVARGPARVQIETTPVMRGAVHPVRTMQTQPGVQNEFGFASIQVLDFADLYAGKLAAALTRQHPRDLFDIGLLLDNDRFDSRLWRTFLVYLTVSQKPAAEILAPGQPIDLALAFRTQFEGMTAAPTSIGHLLDVRERLLVRVGELLDPASQAFLVSVEREAPAFDLIGLPHAAELPGVKRKLRNLARRSPAKREADYRQLADTLGRITRKDTA